jgi:hypothetical protein
MEGSSNIPSNIDDSAPDEPFSPLDEDKNSTETRFQTISPDVGEDWPPTENLEIPCHGWPAMAHLLFKKPGFEFFQDFRDLQIKNLVYYQGQLLQIRKELHQVEWENHWNGNFDPRENLYENMGFRFRNENHEDNRQLVMIKKLRTILREYSELLFLFVLLLFG